MLWEYLLQKISTKIFSCLCWMLQYPAIPSYESNYLSYYINNIFSYFSNYIPQYIIYIDIYTWGLFILLSVQFIFIFSRWLSIFLSNYILSFILLIRFSAVPARRGMLLDRTGSAQQWGKQLCFPLPPPVAATDGCRASNGTTTRRDLESDIILFNRTFHNHKIKNI